jgi:hypothetical protein
MDPKAREALVKYVERDVVNKIIERVPHISPFSDIHLYLAMAYVMRLEAANLVRLARAQEKKADVVLARYGFTCRRKRR